MIAIAHYFKAFLRRVGFHGSVKSFEQEMHAAGSNLLGRADRGVRTVETSKIVGSVGRAETLRSDFFYRRGRAMTDRFKRVGQALERGVSLPPLELYKVKRQAGPQGAAPASEYYVLDGHHRVAMARKLGQDYFDAHVVEYQIASAAPDASVQGAVAEGTQAGAATV
ncbi:MAG TPA: hypothetical protein VFE42_37080 [Chloroflexota bacterium]|nr:hypothetical protein [Chloroflexota bacterium]